MSTRVFTDQPDQPGSSAMAPADSGDGRPYLHTSARHRAGTASVLAVQGELDIATEVMLGTALAEVMAEYGPDVIIDASGISFCDARGLGALVRGANRAEEAGGTLTLTNISAPLDRLLRVVGLEQRLSASGTTPTPGRAPARRP